MLEIFSDWQVTIPEIGTIKATHPPHVILTSNRTRELSDALRRRCLYLWIDYPAFDKEVAIVERKVPGIDGRLAREISRFMESLRRVRLAKVPGRGRDARLGAGAGGPARRPPRRDDRHRDPRLRPQGRRRHQALPRGGGEGRPDAVPPGPRLVPVRALTRAVVRFGGLLRRQSLPDHAPPGPRRRPRARSPRRARTATRSTSACAPSFVTRPEEVGGLRPLPSTRSGGRAPRPTRSARRWPARPCPSDGGGPELESQGGRARAAGPRGLGREEQRGRRRPAQRAGRLRGRGAGRARLLDLQRRAARRRAAAHREDRPAAGPADEPAAPARCGGGAASTCGARCAPTSRAARSSSCATGGASGARSGSSCCATSPARWTSTAASSCSSCSPCSTSSRGWRRSRSRCGSRASPTTCARARTAQVLRRLHDVRDWSGGTRIGESLAEFNREWPHLVDRRTIVIVLSDGWDTGDPDVLATELLRIKRRAARVIWLNPLLGNPSYEPLTRGHGGRAAPGRSLRRRAQPRRLCATSPTACICRTRCRSGRLLRRTARNPATDCNSSGGALPNFRPLATARDTRAWRSACSLTTARGRPHAGGEIETSKSGPGVAPGAPARGGARAEPGAGPRVLDDAGPLPVRDQRARHALPDGHHAPEPRVRRAPPRGVVFRLRAPRSVFAPASV